MWKYVLVWFPMVFLAIANAILRESVFTNFLNDLNAHQMSTFTGAFFLESISG